MDTRKVVFILKKKWILHDILFFFSIWLIHASVHLCICFQVAVVLLSSPTDIFYAFRGVAYCRCCKCLSLRCGFLPFVLLHGLFRSSRSPLPGRNSAPDDYYKWRTLSFWVLFSFFFFFFISIWRCTCVTHSELFVLGLKLWTQRTLYFWSLVH